jgi:hypothetical protein
MYLEVDTYIRTDDLDAEADRYSAEQKAIRDAEEKIRMNAEAKQYIRVLPGHAFALWRESPDKFKPEQETPAALPQQEDTDPLNVDEVDYFLSTPWWEKRGRNPHNIYNFGPICRTMYERIRAFHVPPQKQYPKGCDFAVAFAPSYSFCDSHRNLNEYLDFFAIAEWCEEGRRKPDLSECKDALIHRYTRWSFSPTLKIRMQAERLIDWCPSLKGYIEAHADGVTQSPISTPQSIQPVNPHLTKEPDFALEPDSEIIEC